MLYFGGRSFWKAFRIVGLEATTSRRGLEQDRYGNFRINFKCLKVSSSCKRKIAKLSLTVKADDVTSNTRDFDPHGRFREGFMGKWANRLFCFNS